MTTIGFVGLGAMGGRIAGRLLASGHQVYGTNRTAAKAEPLLEKGLVWRGTPREIAEAAEVVQHQPRVQMLAFGEGLLLAERGGVDREIAVEEMTASAIGSPMLKARAPLVLDLR